MHSIPYIICIRIVHDKISIPACQQPSRREQHGTEDTAEYIYLHTANAKQCTIVQSEGNNWIAITNVCGAKLQYRSLCSTTHANGDPKVSYLLPRAVSSTGADGAVAKRRAMIEEIPCSP